MTKRKTPPLTSDKQAALDDRRQRQRELFADPEAIRDCLEELAEGVPLSGWCEARGFASSTVRMWLVANRPTEYEAIRLTVADGVLDEIAELEREMQRSLRGGGIDPATGQTVAGDEIDRDKASYYRELLKTKMWRVEKLNPARYGQRQNIDMRVTDVNKQQLEAIRHLNKLPRREPRLLAPLASDRLPPLEGELVTAIPLGQTSLPSLQAKPTQLAEPAQPAKPAMSATQAVSGEQAKTAVSAMTAQEAITAEPAKPASIVVPTMPARQAGPARPANAWVRVGLTPQPKVAPGAPAAPSRPRPSFVVPTASTVQLRTAKPT